MNFEPICDEDGLFVLGSHDGERGYFLAFDTYQPELGWGAAWGKPGDDLTVLRGRFPTMADAASRLEAVRNSKAH